LHARLTPLAKLHGNATIARWSDWAEAGATAALTADLLAIHYDPSYERAIRRNFPRYRDATVLAPADASHPAFRYLARELLAESTEPADARPA
jgi:tRNA 2-selenouridine synthase